jgi:hypothetical protein
MKDTKFNRRDFLKYSALMAGCLTIPHKGLSLIEPVSPYPEGARLGRICQGDIGAPTEIKAEPDIAAPTIGMIMRDEVVQIKQEVIAKNLDLLRFRQRWSETEQGYIYSDYIHPVKYILNQPLSELPLDDKGMPGMWVQISVPVAGFEITQYPAASWWIREYAEPKLYYGQNYWAFDIRQKDGRTQYLLTQKYGALPDKFWTDAAFCRPISPEELTPISPEVTNKKMVIRLNHQNLSCYEDGREVFYTEISGGLKRADGTWRTPLGQHLIWRKMVSLHMSAGGMSSFDAPGVSWTTLFDSDGAAIHYAYWHNSFGSPYSHGCINCTLEDSHWLWRWTNPAVAYYPGELTVSGGANSTLVEVVD